MLDMSSTARMASRATTSSIRVRGMENLAFRFRTRARLLYWSRARVVSMAVDLASGVARSEELVGSAFPRQPSLANHTRTPSGRFLHERYETVWIRLPIHQVIPILR